MVGYDCSCEQREPEGTDDGSLVISQRPLPASCADSWGRGAGIKRSWPSSFVLFCISVSNPIQSIPIPTKQHNTKIIYTRRSNPAPLPPESKSDHPPHHPPHPPKKKKCSSQPSSSPPSSPPSPPSPSPPRSPSHSPDRRPSSKQTSPATPQTPAPISCTTACRSARPRAGSARTSARARS